MNETHEKGEEKILIFMSGRYSSKYKLEYSCRKLSGALQRR
jgi:hypothetical protein